jgi:hypothetical protein
MANETKHKEVELQIIEAVRAKHAAILAAMQAEKERKGGVK